LFPLNASERTTAGCQASIWLGHVGYNIAFGALSLKTFRVVQIFNAKTLKSWTPSDSRMAMLFCVWLLIPVIYLAVWTSVAPSRPVRQLEGGDIIYVCSSTSDGSTSLWSTFLLLIEVVGLVWALTLCTQARRVPSLYNEGKYIVLSIYNVALLATLLWVIQYLVDSPSINNLLVMLGAVLVSDITLCLVFLPKIILLLTLAEPHIRDAIERENSRKKGQEESEARTAAALSEMAQGSRQGKCAAMEE
jgi:hypothetical protein